MCEHDHSLSRILAVHFILLNLLLKFVDLRYPLTRQLEEPQVSNEVAVCVTEAGNWMTFLYLFISTRITLVSFCTALTNISMIVFAKHQHFLLSFLTRGYCTLRDKLLTPYPL